MRTILLSLFLASRAFAFDWQSEQSATSFTEESHPGTDATAQNNIRITGDEVGYIKNGNWMRFQNFNFGASPMATNFWIEASKQNSDNSTLRLMLGHPTTGEDVGSVQITQTGGWSNYQRFNLRLSRTLSGTSDLYFVCEGANDLFNLKKFRFQTYGYDRDKDTDSSGYTLESHPNDSNFIQRVGGQVQSIKNGTWVKYDRYNFEDGAQYLWIEAAALNSGGTITIRAGSDTAPSLGTINIPSSGTGGLDKLKPFGCKLSSSLVGIQDLYLTFSGGTGDLFNLGKLRFQRLAPDYKAPGTITDWVKRDPDLQTVKAGTYTTESNPGDDNNIRSGDGISYIANNQWVGYQNFNFGAGANALTINAATETAGGTVEVRVGHPTNGQPIVSIPITNTGSWGNYLPLTVDLGQTLTGNNQDLYLRFVGGSGYLFNVGDLRFQLLDPNPLSTGRLIAAHTFTQQSSPGASQIPGGVGITSVTNGSWISFGNFNFGAGADLITLMAATPNRGGSVEIRVDSVNGPRVATLDVTHTGSWTLFRQYTAALSQTIIGSRNVFMRFVDTNGQSGNLLNLKEFIFEKKQVVTPPPSNQGDLFVYPPVPNLAPSPYYTYSVQKVSDLNAPLKQNATNWLNPFAWFTECKTGSDPFSTAYYSQEIAGWSHTYCNFELGKNTPIVVKITRTPNSFGAPSGPIFMANVHPVHKVQSCEIINGEVYVTMKEPALVTVDIDGQMDARDAPRISPAELASSKPYASREKGSHAVSIFANPVLDDEPVIGAPGVRFVAAGDPLPDFDDPSWTTLYFGKGVHDLGHIPYFLMSNKSYYIPGDAMVYGSFDGAREPSTKKNVRVYGYGTLSCAKIPHYNDSFWIDPARESLNRWLSGIKLSSGYDCRFEGVSLVDPANHGVAFDSGGGNIRRWMKQVSWRANSDMGGIPGIIEDCFFRLQDDGPYVSGNDFRRNTLWFDCNGSPFRGTFIRSGTYAAGDQTIVEDCDIIYVRSNWGGAVISAGDYWEIGTYPDGTKNTAQHVIFRNNRVTDPRPTRTLFGLERGMAGMRFENIEYRHPHSWGYQSNFSGTATEPMSHLYFDGVFVEGKKLDAALVADSSLFQTSNISNFVFRDLPIPPPVSMTTVNTTGFSTALNFDDPQNTYTGSGSLDITSNVSLGSSGSVAPTVFAMTGGLITINSGATLVNGGWSKGIWTNNKSSMQINGTLDVWDGNPVIVDALNGGGAITMGYVWSFRPTELHVGVLGGSGIFSGTIQEPHYAGSYIRIVKQGSGTQTFNNLANQKPGEIVINAGVVNLSTATPATFAANLSGPGNLTKSGVGPLTLSGGLTYTGNTTITAGVLGIAQQAAFANTSAVTIGADASSSAVLNLPITGTDIVAALIIKGIPQVGNGRVYDSSNSSGAITGLGRIQVGLPFTLTTSATNGLIVLDSPSGFYPGGSTATVTASPAAGFVFTGWSGDLSGSASPTSILMNGNKAITANFELQSLPLLRSVWIADASLKPGSTPHTNAIDPSRSTRWSTGVNQANGQWFQVDLGSIRSFNRIVMDVGTWTGHSPASFDVVTSNDNTVWGLPIFSGNGSAVTTMIFPTQTARYIRVRLTAIRSGVPWSIADFSVYGPTLIPIPWVTANVGSVAHVGTVNFITPNNCTLAGSGADIWLTADAFRYVYQISTDDCSIEARVDSMANSDPWAKAGVMIRESTAANSVHAMVCVTPSNGVSFQWRTATAGSCVNASVSGQTAPKWLRLTRSVNTFTAFRSDNGVNWTPVGSPQSINMASSATLGLALTSHNNGILCTSTFSSVTPTP